jgi:hypothetical protein
VLEIKPIRERAKAAFSLKRRVAAEIAGTANLLENKFFSFVEQNCSRVLKDRLQTSSNSNSRN